MSEENVNSAGPAPSSLSTADKIEIDIAIGHRTLCIEWQKFVAVFNVVPGVSKDRFRKNFGHAVVKLAQWVEAENAKDAANEDKLIVPEKKIIKPRVI